MDEEEAEVFVNRSRTQGMTMLGQHKKAEPKEAAFDLIGGKSQGGSIYAIDHDEMLRLAFK